MGPVEGDQVPEGCASELVLTLHKRNYTFNRLAGENTEHVPSTGSSVQGVRKQRAIVRHAPSLHLNLKLPACRPSGSK